MNETHTFHNSSGFPPTHPSSEKQWDIVAREKKSLFNRLLLLSLHFPLFPSHVFPPLSPSFFFLHSLFPYLSCYLYDLTPLTLGSFRMEGSPGGGSGGRLRKVCVWKRVCDPPATPAQRALCTRPWFITPPLFSTLLSFYAIPFLCSRCQSCPLTLSCTHMHTYKHTSNCYPVFIVGRDHSFFPGREACRELCGSKPRALAVAACDAATNSNRVPPGLEHPAAVSLA